MFNCITGFYRPTEGRLALRHGDVAAWNWLEELTDSGNRILDCRFGPIADTARLEQRIRRVVGVVESGLFIASNLAWGTPSWLRLM